MNALRLWLKGKMFRLPMMITCREAEDFIIDYLEGDLPARQRRLFEWHLSLCRECRDYLDAYKRTIALGQSVMTDPDKAASDEMPEDLVTAILATKRGSEPH